MWKLEFRPSFFSIERLILLAICIISAIAIGMIVFAKTYVQPTIANSILIATVAIFVPWITILPVAVLQMAGKRIWIENDLMYIANKPVFGPIKTNIIQLENLTTIVSPKSPLAIISKKLLFTFKDHKTEEVAIEGWDEATLKNVLFYIKGKHPYVIFNTHFYKDPPEYFSGLKEILDKSARKNSK